MIVSWQVELIDAHQSRYDVQWTKVFEETLIRVPSFGGHRSQYAATFGLFMVVPRAGLSIDGYGNSSN